MAPKREPGVPAPKIKVKLTGKRAASSVGGGGSAGGSEARGASPSPSGRTTTSTRPRRAPSRQRSRSASAAAAAAAAAAESMSEDADLEERMSDGDGDGGDGELAMACGGRGRSATPGAAGLAGAKDYTDLPLKPDHAARPLWVCPDGRIILETWSPAYRAATDFLVAVAEPVCRPASLHEYALTPHSLYAAVSVGLDAGTVAGVLDRLCKTALPPAVAAFIAACTGNFGKVKLVLRQGRFWVESPHPAILRELLADDVIAGARVVREAEEGDAGGGAVAAQQQQERQQARQPHDHQPAAGSGGFALITDAPADVAGPAIAADAVQAADEAVAAAEAGGAAPKKDGEADGAQPQPPPPPPAAAPPPPPRPRDLVAFEVDPAKVEHVKARCLPGGLNYPMLEEYDFRADTANPDLEIALRPGVQHRPYQDKAMAKMFGNGRARSGVIVLPCGAGKSLVGITAAARVRKSVLVLVTNNVSVDQWKHQFKLWTNLQDHNIARFTADAREEFEGDAGVAITTYTMVAYTGRRADGAARVMEALAAREWGLLILDEVHVVPAAMFRRVIGIVKAHAKLGLTATLVREDALIADLNFLIGPKLYEANWLDLTRAGHIANVQCAEVWCPLTREFAREYLRPENAGRRPLLHAMNPSKFRAAALLVDYHERVRRDKVIVFSDNIFALREYAVRLRRPFIYGGTPHAERTRVLARFKTDPALNTVFLSKVGDNSIDIPEANVLIQVSSHAGSRRQEAQRLGRILRAKRPRGGGPPPPDEFNAFFYSLVSTDTQEMYYSAKRQQFLIDQGYAFKIITNLLDEAAAAGGAGGPGDDQLASTADQLDLLARVLAAGADEAGEEMLPGEEGAPAGGGGAGGGGGGAAAATRREGTLAGLSGAGGRTYLEYAAGGGGGGRSGGAGGSGGPPKQRHAVFKRHAAGKL